MSLSQKLFFTAMLLAFFTGNVFAGVIFLVGSLIK